MKKRLIFGNTRENGKLTFLAYQEKPNYYIGVCLEFNLLVEAKTLEEAMKKIKETAWFYLENVIKHKLPDSLLNEPAPKEYWKKFMEIVEKIRVEQKKLYWERKLQSIIYNPDIIRQQIHV